MAQWASPPPGASRLDLALDLSDEKANAAWLHNVDWLTGDKPKKAYQKDQVSSWRSFPTGLGRIAKVGMMPSLSQSPPTMTRQVSGRSLHEAG